MGRTAGCEEYPVRQESAYANLRLEFSLLAASSKFGLQAASRQAIENQVEIGTSVCASASGINPEARAGVVDFQMHLYQPVAQ
jgi:hypothetical protein